MANRVIYFNGVPFYPTAIQRNDKIIGNQIRMGAGNLKTFIRVKKREWTLSWNGVAESLVPGIEGIFNGAAMTYVDERGATYTVVPDIESWSAELDAGDIALNGVFYYNVEVKIMEV